MQPRMRIPITRRDFLLTASVAAGAVLAAPVLGLEDAASARSTSSAAEEDLDAFVRRQMRVAHLPSLETEVVAGTDVVRSRAYGWADLEEGLRAGSDTAYLLASISKTVICAAVMQVWEAGSVGLDVDVNTYLPFEVRNPNHPKAGITTRMLLLHTSSIVDRWIWGTMNDPSEYGWTHGDSAVPLHDVLTAYLVPGGELYDAAGNFAETRPGKVFNYSSLGADLAAYIVEVVSGVPFGEFCTDNLFGPLGMDDTGYHLSDLGISELAMPYRRDADGDGYQPYYQYGTSDYPCCMLRTSSTSLSRWLRCFMNLGELDGVRILKRGTVREIFRPQVTDSWGGQQALIWYYEERGGEVRLGHGGMNYGVNTTMSFVPERGVGVIMLANRLPVTTRSWNRWFEIQERLFNEA